MWKVLEQTYGLSDADDLIEMKNQWTRLTMTNWKYLGTLFAQLKKMKNDIKWKTRALLG